MLLKMQTLEGIANGSISLAFRRWRKPAVKAGGTLKTAIGVLAIDAVDVVDESAITAKDAVRAGFASAAELKKDLAGRTEGDVYRVRLRYAGEDPRIALRADDSLDDDVIDDLRTRLQRLDRTRAWTRKTLELIAAHPGRRSPELAELVGQDTPTFKANVRKLKALGLTESLEVGYRLSPRGSTLLNHLRKA